MRRSTLPVSHSASLHSISNPIIRWQCFYTLLLWTAFLYSALLSEHTCVAQPQPASQPSRQSNAVSQSKNEATNRQPISNVGAEDSSAFSAPSSTSSSARSGNADALGVDAAIASASVLSSQVSSQEWLGPLAAVALSPFFGIACLSGLATYGPESLQNGNALLSANGPMNNPYLFWTMLVLTLVTSLPRFTKVSKPISLMIEKLEASSAIVILLVIRFSISRSDPDGVLTAMDSVSQDLLAAGVLQSSTAILMSIAAVVNVLVINSIKLFTEILVWLMPIPFVDGLLEIANKSLCLGLMAIYSYSPALATLLNLALLVLCGLVFFRVKRRLRSMRELMLKPILAKAFGVFRPSKTDWIAFLASPWNSIPMKSAIYCHFDTSTGSWSLEHRGWITRTRVPAKLLADRCKPGMISDQVVFEIAGREVQFDVRKDLGLSQIVGLGAGNGPAVA